MSARGGMTPTRPGVERRGSQSSMTERTFRSPSPGNTPQSRKARAVPAAADAPPVPNVPGRRSASVEPPIPRVTSPTPRGGRGVSVDRTSFAAGKRITSLPQLPELEREGSQRSVNFSRPMASPPASPTTSPSHQKGSGSWFTSPTQGNGSPRTTGPTRPHSSLGLSRNEVSGIQSDLRNVADKPVAKKKKTVVAKEGKRLAAGTMVTGLTGTAVNGGSSRPTSPAIVNRSAAASPAPSETTTPMKKKKSPTAPAVDTDVQPPPRNPARAMSPTPMKSALQKKPSVVREDPEAEETAEVRARNSVQARPASALSGSRSSSMLQTSEGPVVSYLAPNAPRARAASLGVPDAHKYAHFSKDIVDANGVKHTPPPRSISPAKSAMKYSPASSIRTSSPGAANTSPRPPTSDASDTMSVASQDGVKPGKKKKSARVSFDGDALGGGQEAQRPQQAIPTNGRRPLSPALNDDQDEMMQPRPALPSFGSVRSASSPARTQTASTHPSTKSALAPNGSASNDHTVGAAPTNDHSTRQASTKSANDPLPPQVTSVEGSGYQSDSSHYSEDEESAAITSKTVPPATITTTAGSTDTTIKPIVADIMIPDISVLPATPGIEEDAKQSLLMSAEEKDYSVPGGWGESEVEQKAKNAVLPVVIDEEYQRPSPRLEAIEESDSDDSDAFSDAAEDPSEFDGGFASLDAIVHSPISPPSREASAVTESPTPKVVRETPAVLQQSPEEQSEEVGSGDWTQATAYWSSLSKQHKEQLENQAVVQEDAEVAVIEEPKMMKKRSKAAVVAPAGVATLPVPAARPSKATPKNTPKKAVDSSTQPQPTSMRKSMRNSQQGAPVPAAAEAPTQMRKSMRNTESPRTSGSMRGSMRDGQGPSPRQRPMSMVQQADSAQQQSPARPASMGGMSAASAAVRGSKPAPSAASPYMKMPQDDSDSESSFKKKRRPSTSTVDSMGRYNMRRSMRAGSVDMRPQSPTNVPASSKWSIRSSSPPANPRASMRQSLRRGSMDDVPTMRGKNSKAAARDSKSPSRFSVSSFRSAKPAPAAPPPQSKTKTFRSRFNDSDDEGEAPAPARGRTFASRFADSDDEADSPTVPQRVIQNDYTPVRGIPRRAGQDDDDSTDLDDSDDDTAARRRPASKRVSKAPVVPSQTDIDKVMEQARRNVAAQTGNSNIGLPEQTTPKKKVTLRTEPETDGPVTNGHQSPSDPNLNKRRGLLGSIFGRKRTMSSSTIPRLQTTEPAQQQMSLPASPATPTRGKLQRRHTGQLSRQASSASVLQVNNMPAQNVSIPGAVSQTSQNWPLPPPIPESEPVEIRPNTSDGVSMPRTLRDRPDTMRRSQSGVDIGSKADNAIYSDRTGKKKRFGKLRKAFGLND